MLLPFHHLCERSIHSFALPAPGPTSPRLPGQRCARGRSRSGPSDALRGLGWAPLSPPTAGPGQGDLLISGHGGHLAIPVPAHCHRGFHGGQVLSDSPLHRGPLCPGFGPHCGGGFFLPSGGDRARKTHQAPDLGYRGSREVQVGAQPGPRAAGGSSGLAQPLGKDDFLVLVAAPYGRYPAPGGFCSSPPSATWEFSAGKEAPWPGRPVSDTYCLHHNSTPPMCPSVANTLAVIGHCNLSVSVLTLHTLKNVPRST